MLFHKNIFGEVAPIRSSKYYNISVWETHNYNISLDNFVDWAYLVPKFRRSGYLKLLIHDVHSTLLIPKNKTISHFKDHNQTTQILFLSLTDCKRFLENFFLVQG